MSTETGDGGLISRLAQLLKQWQHCRDDLEDQLEADDCEAREFREGQLDAINLCNIELAQLLAAEMTSRKG